MDLTELQRRVDKYLKLDLAPLYEAYRGKAGDGTVDGFLAYLGESKAVSSSILMELHAATEVEIPKVTDAAFVGTSLADWAKTNLGRGRDGEPGRGSPNPSGSPEDRMSKVSIMSRDSFAETFHAGTPPDAAAASASTPGPAFSLKREVRFTPIAKLGEGAMGAVHVARDLFLRRKVALKSVLPGMAMQEELITRFLSEMQITAQLEHPNIVPVYALEVGADGTLGYAMKLVQGKDLEQVLDEARAAAEKGQPLDEEHKLEKRLEYFLKVCDALEYAHDRGIVHRDLKPSNVMIGRHNEVYLMDWGIARPMGQGGQALDSGLELRQGDKNATPDASRTQLGAAIGTPSYMSPEQAAGKNLELDARSDVYAMGLILQECVSLKRAVDGRTLEEVLSKALLARRDPVPVGTQPFQVPREIDAIVRKATRSSPKDRYPNVRALAEEVRRFVRGEPVEALPEGPLRRAGRWLSRHRTASLALILGLALVGAGGTIGALVNGQARLAASHARELRESHMQTEAAMQAQGVDRKLSRYEAALTEFAGAAGVVLSKQPQADFAPYYEELLASKETAPADFGPSRRYGTDVSVFAPAVAIAPGVARDEVEPLARSLGSLAGAFRSLFLGASGVDWHKLGFAEQRAAIADVGIAAYRARVVLGEGITLTFPATAARSSGDARSSASYKNGPTQQGVVWGKPTGDAEPLLPGTVALYDDRGVFRGVATLEVSLNRLLVDDDRAELDSLQSRFLVGRDGKLMAEKSTGAERAALPTEVADAIAAGKSGSMVVTVNGKPNNYVFYPLASLDAYYVASGDVERVKTSDSKMVAADPRRAPEARATVKVTSTASAAPVVTTVAAIAPPVAPGDVDAGSRVDAGAGSPAEAPVSTLYDAGAPARLKGPMPKPSGDLPPNPFERWKVYDKPRKK